MKFEKTLVCILTQGFFFALANSPTCTRFTVIRYVRQVFIFRNAPMIGIPRRRIIDTTTRGQYEPYNYKESKD